MQRLVTQLKDWEILSDDNLTGVSGVDLTVTDRDVQVATTNVDDIVNLTVSAIHRVDGRGRGAAGRRLAARAGR